MDFPLSYPSATLPHVIYGAACITTIYVVVKFARPYKLDGIPTVGSSGWFGSWVASLRFVTNGINIVQGGYKKAGHKSVPFKVADRDGWTVIISSLKHIQQLRKAPDDELSLQEAIHDQLKIRYMFGDQIQYDTPYHIPIIRSQLTRNIGIMYSDIRDEIETALDEILDLRDHEWKSVSVLSLIQNVVCRTTNRIFVGLPLCRNPDWIDLNIQYTVDIVKTGFLLGLLPKFLRPLAARFLTAVPRGTMRGVKLFGPIVESRLKQSDECGDKSAEQPNDLISWLMEEINDSRMTVERLTTNILLINFAAIHTTSASFTHALLYLAANPQVIQPLREEVEAIVEKEGWSKTAIGKMRKVDSFLRECQRMEGLDALGVWRKAMKDFRFSDGTFIPEGTVIGVATRCIHHDEEFYPNPDVFEPFRFAEMQDNDGEGGKFQFVSTSPEYQPFGHGKHACPGRFFAANEMKTMLAHIVTTYDIKLPDGATHPPSLRFATAIFPDPSAKLLFRRRVD